MKAARPRLPAATCRVSAARVSATRALIGAAVAAGAARGAYTALRQHPPSGEQTWSRTNHRGETVTLLEGPALAAGAVAGQLIAPLSAAAQLRGANRGDLAVTVAGLGGLAFGVLDDLRGSAKRRGLRGHLGALAHGELTTGTVKLAGLAATGLGAALLEGGDRADVVINAGLVAGGANLLNLFDLRPGRAIKVATGSAALITVVSAVASRPPVNGGVVKGARGSAAGAAAVAAPVGASLALLPDDLGERAMLGDAGANALGAMLGAAAARALPRSARLCLLAGFVALTVASEKVSFTKVIAATPPLHWLDMLGRRPAQLRAPVSNKLETVTAAADTVRAVTAETGKTGKLAWWIARRPGRHRRTRVGA